MNIEEIDKNSKDVSIEAKVAEIGEIRSVNTRFGQKDVCTITIEDDSGKINLSIWGDDIKKFEVGKSVKVTGAYVTEWHNDLQLNVPRDGTTEVVD
ncbi:MAG: hypothetical protein KAJ54_00510 [Candidatus Aenigmarchaeota archaeon]|nr:hypothetical protein [Candidatus Aenigmarchaeota archaeon]